MTSIPKETTGAKTSKGKGTGKVSWREDDDYSSPSLATLSFKYHRATSPVDQLPPKPQVKPK